MRSIFSLIVALAAFWLFAGSAAAKVGIASVVDGDPVGQPPGAVERTLRIGTDMIADEKVTTHKNDRAHLVFLDGSSLTVGPDSQIVIDRFVYDPNKKAGDLALSVGRGTVRFVGGMISKKSEVKVVTPAASMGIRGGILMLAVASDGETVANFLYGQVMTVSSQGVTRTLTVSGFQVRIRPGEPPSLPIPIPPASLREMIGALERGVAAAERDPLDPTRQGAATGQGGNSTGAAVIDALTDQKFSSLNSDLDPFYVASAAPTPQQLALLLQGREGPLPSGPLLASTLEGISSPGRSPLEGSGPLESPDPWGLKPLLGDGPFMGAGSLIGDGPLTGAPPFLNVDPAPFGGLLITVMTVPNPPPFIPANLDVPGDAPFALVPPPPPANPLQDLPPLPPAPPNPPPADPPPPSPPPFVAPGSICLVGCPPSPPPPPLTPTCQSQTSGCT